MEQVKMLDVKDVQRILKIGRNSAYNLMQSKKFPSMQIGRKWLISEEALNKWIKENEHSSVMLDKE